MKILTVTDAAIRTRCREQFPRLSSHDVVLLDTTYQLIAGERADNVFAKLAAQAAKVFPGGYQPNRRDCDKYSRLVAALASASHSMQEGAEAGLALGILNYEQDRGNRSPGAGANHSVNVIFVRFKGRQSVDMLVYEPQTGARLELTLTERQNAKIVIV